VFGGERLGLARCAAHQNLARLTADEILRQIVAGAANRRPSEKVPSLQGFAHSLRRCGHPDLALAYGDIHARLRDLGRQHGTDTRVGSVVAAAAAGWERQMGHVATASADGARLLERLRSLIRSGDPRYGDTVADSISLAEFKAARKVGGTDRPAMLFVRVPEDLRGLFIGPGGSRIRRYGEQLDVVVKIEGGRPRR
jgi:hypothetical protein